MALREEREGLKKFKLEMQNRAREENDLKDQVSELQQMQKELMHTILENERDRIARDDLANMRP